MTARIQGAAGKDKSVPKKSCVTGTMLRIRRALWLVLGMLSLSLLLVVLGVYITTRTESLTVSGYTSGVILTLGSFLGLLGLCLEENRKQLVLRLGHSFIVVIYSDMVYLHVYTCAAVWSLILALLELTAAIVFLSFGIISSFLCLVIDGVSIVFNLDMRPLKAGRCQYYSSGGSYIYEHFYTSVPCWTLKESCNMTVRSGTCYCCDLYDCANGGYLSNYYEFVGVHSCEEVFTLYILMWTLTVLNLAAFFTGILTTAVLGSIKDLSCLHSQTEGGRTENKDKERISSQVTDPSKSAASSPTAPLLMHADAHREHQLHPGVSVYFPPAEGTAASHSFPSSSPSHTEFNPPPFAPQRSLLTYTIQGNSA